MLLMAMILPLGLAIAAFMDLFTMTIPNRVSLFLFLSFLFIIPFVDMTLSDMSMHFLSGFVMLFACFVLFSFNIMGGGDAKLLAVTSLWFGFGSGILTFITYVGVFGGLFSIIVLLTRNHASTLIAYKVPIPRSILTAKEIPYGIAIALGGFFAYPVSPIFLAAIKQSI